MNEAKKYPKPIITRSGNRCGCGGSHRRGVYGDEEPDRSRR